MWASVESAWPTVARHHEGVYSWMYLDPIGEVTVGVGLLIEANNRPSEECFGLPWTVDGHPATRAQVSAGWAAVKAHDALAGQASRFETVSRLRLDDKTINAALTARTHEFWSVLHSQLVDLDGWPADAQLGLIDLAYQLGPHFLGSAWPNFTAGAHASDFTKCSQHCSVKQASTERNAHRKRLFVNAAQVVAFGNDPARLWDQEPVKEDEMPISPEDRAALVADIVKQITPLIPTAAAVAEAVLNSALSDVIPVKDKRGNLWLKNAIGEIHTAVGAKP